MTTKVPYSMLDNDVTVSILNALFPVGSVTLRMDAINPGTIYGGTWSLIEGDASLAPGDGTPQPGTPHGWNDVVPTLLAHDHTGNTGVNNVNHTHTAGDLGFVGNLLPDHDHGIGLTTSSGVGAVLQGSGVTATVTTHLASAGTPTGTIVGSTAGVSDNHVHAIEPDGDSALLNIRGARININVWLRTA